MHHSSESQRSLRNKLAMQFVGIEQAAHGINNKSPEREVLLLICKTNCSTRSSFNTDLILYPIVSPLLVFLCFSFFLKWLQAFLTREYLAAHPDEEGSVQKLKDLIKEQVGFFCLRCIMCISAFSITVSF